MDKVQKPKMIFNIIFSIWLMITYAPSTSAITSLFSGNFISIIIGLLTTAFGIGVVATGILLINRKELGYKLQFFINGLGIAVHGIVNAGCILATFSMGFLSSEYQRVLGIFGILFCVVIIIFSLPALCMHIAGLIYYIKCKDKYFAVKTAEYEYNEQSQAQFNNYNGEN